MLERSAGGFALLRPRSLRWEIETPDRQLLIASDGQLTQVDWDSGSGRRTGNTAETSAAPSTGCWRRAPSWRRPFRSRCQEQTAILTPYDSGALYQRLEITYEPAAGWQLKAADRGGQVLSIDLSEDRERLPTAADFVVPDTPF